MATDIPLSQLYLLFRYRKYECVWVPEESIPSAAGGYHRRELPDRLCKPAVLWMMTVVPLENNPAVHGSEKYRSGKQLMCLKSHEVACSCAVKAETVAVKLKLGFARLLVCSTLRAHCDLFASQLVELYQAPSPRQ